MLGGIIYTIVGCIEFLLGMRFVLRLFGANPASDFVAWVYDWSTPLVTPFAGIFGQNPTVDGLGVVARSVFDWTTLIALVVYSFVGILIARVFAGSSHSRP